MKILIFGGNRFVGKRVLSTVAAQGHSITLINRGTPDGIESSLIIRVHLDRTSDEQMNAYFSKIKDHYDLVLDFSCYLPAQAFLARKFLDGRVNRYLFISTQSVYEDHLQGNIAESDFNPYTLDLGTIPKNPAEMDYSTCKQFTEAVFFQNTNQVPVSIRFPFILGPDDYTQRFMFHVDRVKQGLPIYFPAIDAQISMIHAKDACEALLTLAFSSNFQGPLNVCSKEPISLRAMMTMIENKVGKKAIYSSTEENKSSSPYGVSTDRFMSVDKMNQLGIHTRSILEWLPTLF